MLEDIAIQYISQTEGNLKTIAVCISIFGGILAGIFHRSNAELDRGAYFAFSGLLFFASAVEQLVWLGSIPALSGGYLWSFMLSDVLVGLAVGYGYCVIAMARSKAAYGNRRAAALAFIPIGNLWLLFTPTKNDASAHRTPTLSIFTGGMGVFSGFVMFGIAAGLLSFIQIEIEQRITDAQSDPSMQQMGIDVMIKSNGLESTLKTLALGVPTPAKVDEVTTIVKVEGDGTTLRYVYEVSNDTTELTQKMRTDTLSNNCNYTVMRPVFEAGGNLQHVYSRRDGSIIGTIEVNKEICGF